MVRLVPSGGAFDTMLAAMPPPPPVLFSTVIDWPSRGAHLSANNRLTMSGLPPGEVPTRMRSERLGHSDCARAGKALDAARPAARPNASRLLIRMFASLAAACHWQLSPLKITLAGAI